MDLAHKRHFLVAGLLSGLLLIGAGCATKDAPSSPVSDDNYWELPDESLTSASPRVPRAKPPVKPETVPPAAPNNRTPAPAANEPAADTSGEASAEKNGSTKRWWSLGGGAETSDEPEVPVSPTPSDPLPTPEPPVAPPPVADTAMSTVLAYRLRIGDGLVIRITGPEQHSLEDQIDERGNISLPLISEPVRVEGMTGSELESHIRNLYVKDKKIYRRCSVTVLVPGRSYTMDGEFLKKGSYPISPGVTLVRAVASAGGFGPWANPKKLILIRNGVRQTINYYDLRDDPDQDIIIEPGDILIAPRSRI